MSGLLVFGVDVEKTYGTAFYLALNFMIAFLSTLMTLCFYLLMAYCVPISFRGGPQNFYNCGVGYSNVLFGIALVFSYVGEPHFNFFNMCRIDKKLMPWLYMLMIYFTIPDSSFLGHFCGLIAGLMIKFAGIYTLMPRYEWIKEFDEGNTAYKIEAIGYYHAQPEIITDFDS